MQLLKLQQKISDINIYLHLIRANLPTAIKSIKIDSYLSFHKCVAQLTKRFIKPLSDMQNRSNNKSLFNEMRRAAHICCKKRHAQFDNYSSFHSDLYDLILDTQDLILSVSKRITSLLATLYCARQFDYKEVYQQTLAEL